MLVRATSAAHVNVSQSLYAPFRETGTCAGPGDDGAELAYSTIATDRRYWLGDHGEGRDGSAHSFPRAPRFAHALVGAGALVPVHRVDTTPDSYAGLGSTLSRCCSVVMGASATGALAPSRGGAHLLARGGAGSTGGAACEQMRASMSAAATKRAGSGGGSGLTRSGRPRGSPSFESRTARTAGGAALGRPAAAAARPPAPSPQAYVDGGELFGGCMRPRTHARGHAFPRAPRFGADGAARTASPGPGAYIGPAAYNSRGRPTGGSPRLVDHRTGPLR
ncbi:hypothetical protein KFE25_004397 [Diacronema lutheri]|uniref:Uncharacterized protein n=1 Tax=Diacronema lutheri TaxID=2081491 RepID=A0A8J5X799_DIALT|nr:hypothetical protein KFE25_004397 [Diacronema lutheri]